MKKYLLGILFLFSGSASALPISETHTITANGTGSVGYTYFTVTGAGVFDFYTMGPTIDPVLYLFVDDGALDATDYLANDDDNCSNSLCGPAGSWFNSLIDEFTLGTGNYILAVSDFGFSLNEAVSGLNNNDRVGDVAIVIDIGSTDNGGAAAHLRATNAIPEPASLALLGLGVISLSFSRRKRS